MVYCIIIAIIILYILPNIVLIKVIPPSLLFDYTHHSPPFAIINHAKHM